MYREFLSSGASHKKEETEVLGIRLGSILVNKGRTNIGEMFLRLADNARTLRSDEVRISDSIRSPLRGVTAVLRIRDSLSQDVKSYMGVLAAGFTSDQCSRNRHTS